MLEIVTFKPQPITNLFDRIKRSDSADVLVDLESEISRSSEKVLRHADDLAMDMLHDRGYCMVVGVRSYINPSSDDIARVRLAAIYLAQSCARG